MAQIANQTPRIDLYQPGDTTKADLLLELLQEYGMTFLPWQQLVLKRWLAEDKDGNQYDEEDLPDIFDAEIVSYEYPEPIKNTFSFAGFCDIYSTSSGVMVLVGIVTIILCMIFARKSEGVTYGVLDVVGIIFNFAAILFVLPVAYILAVVIQAFPTGPDWIYQGYLCVPPIIPFTVAASLSLRRKGFKKLGFFIQFLAPVIEVILIICEMIL